MGESVASFLITFKPASENPERGWPLEELQRVAARVQADGSAVEKWRFQNRRAPAIGDRIFLLLQGKRGPAVIGYGRVAGVPEKIEGRWQTPVRFERLCDPSAQVLADKSDIQKIDASRSVWRTQSSGVQLPDSVAEFLERLVVGRPAKPFVDEHGINPDWLPDELIVALDVYLRYRPNPPPKESDEIVALSDTLQQLGERLFSDEERQSTFRNPNGVYMKLMNFRRLDPQYTSEGKKGLERGAEAEVEVWNEFAQVPDRCHAVASAIRASLRDNKAGTETSVIYSEPDFQEAPEGRLLTREHVARERNGKLIKAKRKHVLKREGRLACEVCGFDFAARYGERGDGFIECHHLKPVSTLTDGHKTHLDDLAVLCANCHRIVHRRRPWLSPAELKQLLTIPPP